ncbi:hypothetical protein GH733_013419 [Mirounga leonina]|nr:hypothetical protein GH733_013419 [Mirounga leonina]
MAKIEARDLRGKKKEELLKQLEDLKVELSQLRVTKVTGGAASKLSKIRGVRKSIARVLTVINQTQKENLRKFYKGKKYKPLDLRPKKTRAMRRRLNKLEENLKTKQQQWKERLYPLWKCALLSPGTTSEKGDIIIIILIVVVVVFIITIPCTDISLQVKDAGLGIRDTSAEVRLLQEPHVLTILVTSGELGFFSHYSALKAPSHSAFVYFYYRLYFLVLIGGLAGIISILFLLVNMNTRSVTTTAVVNLVVVHSVFLLTVPFRLTYLIKHTWMFGLRFCKFVSAMLHIHMYLTFLFYVVILVIRYLIFFKRKDKVEFYRKLHAVAASAGMWLLVIVIVVPVVAAQYGTHQVYDEQHCFKFHKELGRVYVRAINYMIVTIVIATAMVLLVFQIFIIMSMCHEIS